MRQIGTGDYTEVDTVLVGDDRHVETRPVGGSAEGIDTDQARPLQVEGDRWTGHVGKDEAVDDPVVVGDMQVQVETGTDRTR